MGDHAVSAFPSRIARIIHPYLRVDRGEICFPFRGGVTIPSHRRLSRFRLPCDLVLCPPPPLRPPLLPVRADAGKE